MTQIGHSDHATGNPDAAPMARRSEVVGSTNGIAPAPPGGPSYMDGRCGVMRSDGRVCTRRAMDNYPVCLGHLRGYQRAMEASSVDET